MMLWPLEDQGAAAIFLDFAAAFPSISQQYIQECLRRIGVPAPVILAFQSLYDECRCQVSVKGHMFEGFHLTSGVRQGCPLSPLIYAIVAGSLLDTIEARWPTTFVRAYADGTTLAVQDFWAAAPGLSTLFTSCARTSGLRT